MPPNVQNTVTVPTIGGNRREAPPVNGARSTGSQRLADLEPEGETVAVNELPAVIAPAGPGRRVRNLADHDMVAPFTLAV